MNVSDVLDAREREALYSGANSAIWYSHHFANHHAPTAAREEDYVATLVTDGVPFLADRWTELLQPKGITVRVSGVFCHGHPQVSFGKPPRQVELADLLVVHQHTSPKGSVARAILLQAKMSTDATHNLSSDDSQLFLFSEWPKFEFVTGGLRRGWRDLEEVGEGSRYALIFSGSAYPESISWPDQCPWAESKAMKNLSGDRSLAKLLGDLILGEDGREFEPETGAGEWSRTIRELLEVTGARTYKRGNINRGDTSRLSGEPPISGFLLMSDGRDSGQVWPVRHGDSLVEKMFGKALISSVGGDNSRPLAPNEESPEEGGISSLIIETVGGYD